MKREHVKYYAQELYEMREDNPWLTNEEERLEVENWILFSKLTDQEWLAVTKEAENCYQLRD